MPYKGRKNLQWTCKTNFIIIGFVNYKSTDSSAILCPRVLPHLAGDVGYMGDRGERETPSMRLLLRSPRGESWEVLGLVFSS